MNMELILNSVAVFIVVFLAVGTLFMAWVFVYVMYQLVKTPISDILNRKRNEKIYQEIAEEYFKKTGRKLP